MGPFKKLFCISSHNRDAHDGASKTDTLYTNFKQGGHLLWRNKYHPHILFLTDFSKIVTEIRLLLSLEV